MATLWRGVVGEGHQKGNCETRACEYILSRSSRGSDSSSEKAGSEGGSCARVEKLVCEAGRWRAGLTAGESCMVVSELALDVDERESERGGEEREAMLWCLL